MIREAAVFYENLERCLEFGDQSLIQHSFMPIRIDQKVFDRSDISFRTSSNHEFRRSKTQVNDRAWIRLLKPASSFLMICRLKSGRDILAVHHSDVHRPPPPLPQQNQGIEVCRIAFRGLIVFRGLPVVQKIVSLWL